MKPTKEQLYDAFGELLYAICMIDGQVQEAEARKIEQLLTGHEAAKEIEWSFVYEHERSSSVQEAYAKALDICKYYGPSTEYPFLFDAVRQVAGESQGISPEEKKIIEQFEGELKEHFLKQAEQDFQA